MITQHITFGVSIFLAMLYGAFLGYKIGYKEGQSDTLIAESWKRLKKLQEDL